MPNIRISKEYGLNPSILICPVCGKESGALALYGTSFKDENGKTAKAPIQTIGTELCNECKEYAEKENVIYFCSIHKEGCKSNDNTCKCRIIASIAIDKNYINPKLTKEPLHFLAEDVFNGAFGEIIKQKQEHENSKTQC